MIKLGFAVLALIVAAVVAGIYFQFDPALLILAILAVGLFVLLRMDGPTLPPDEPGRPRRRRIHFFGGADIWLPAPPPEPTYNVNDGAPRETPGSDRSKR